MICVIKTFSKRMAGWVLGWLKRTASNWATQLFVAAILLYSSWIIWQVASGTAFLPQSAHPTLIQLDLLQAMAFLVAWSALIITITAKAVSANKDFELKIAKVGWAAENNRSTGETLGAEQQQLRSGTRLARRPTLPTRETFLGTSREPPMWERAAPVKDNREEP